MTAITNPLKRVKGGASAVTTMRPGWFVYGALAVFLIASMFPLDWSFLIASGDSGTLTDPEMSWLPGGNFIANAATVISNPAVGFWKALGNSIIVSTAVSVSTVILSTLAGYAFAKLRFKGSGPLLIGTDVPTKGVTETFRLKA